MGEAGIPRRDRHFAGPNAIARVVASPAGRERPPAPAGGVGRRAMDDHGLKHQAVAGLQCPRQDLVPIPLALDVG